MEIYGDICLWKDRLQSNVTLRLWVSALGLIILWSSKTRGSKSVWAKYLEIGKNWVFFELSLRQFSHMRSLTALKHLVTFSLAWMWVTHTAEASNDQWCKGYYSRLEFQDLLFFWRLNWASSTYCVMLAPRGVVMIAIGVLPNYWISPFCYFVTTWGSNEPPWLAAWLYDWLYDWDWFLSV